MTRACTSPNAPTTRSPASICQSIYSSGHVRTLTRRLQSSPPSLPPSCAKAGCSMQSSPVKLRLVRQWLTKAHRDLGAAEQLSRTPEFRETAVYHCQQAAEKALKAFLVWVEIPPPRTHDLADLLLACASSEPTFSNLDAAARKLS